MIPFTEENSLGCARKRFQAVQPGHGNDHEHHIRQLFFGQFEGFAPVSSFDHHLDSGHLFQKRANARTHQGVVVGE
jgi:hypothetical protein